MITAVVLAAGASRRMGQPKLLLPWGSSSVLGHVLEVLRAAEVEDVLVVTGAARAEVEEICRKASARIAFNADHGQGEMLSSLQVGLVEADARREAALVTLGDQPQIEESTVRRLVQEYQESGASLIVPSYEMRRGHPWLVHRALWEEILRMNPPESPREFLTRHARDIRYVSVDTASVLSDLDTPEDYKRARPELHPGGSNSTRRP